LSTAASPPDGDVDDDEASAAFEVNSVPTRSDIARSATPALAAALFRKT